MYTFTCTPSDVHTLPHAHHHTGSLIGSLKEGYHRGAGKPGRGGGSARGGGGRGGRRKEGGGHSSTEGDSGSEGGSGEEGGRKRGHTRPEQDSKK